MAGGDLDRHDAKRVTTMSEKKSSPQDLPDARRPPLEDRRSTPSSTDLSDSEKRAFAELPGELPPPPGLEERLVEALRREGLIEAENATPRVRLLLAASLLALGVGLGTGWLLRGALPQRASVPPSAPSGSTPTEYLLALYEAPGVSADESEHRRLAAEYGAWARKRAAAGELLAGEPLAPRGWLLPAPGASAHPTTLPSSTQPELVGYFLIRAPDAERALEIAEDCPHLRHGGSVLVRPIRE